MSLNNRFQKNTSSSHDYNFQSPSTPLKLSFVPLNPILPVKWIPFTILGVIMPSSQKGPMDTWKPPWNSNSHGKIPHLMDFPHVFAITCFPEENLGKSHGHLWGQRSQALPPWQRHETRWSPAARRALRGRRAPGPPGPRSARRCGGHGLRRGGSGAGSGADEAEEIRRWFFFAGESPIMRIIMVNKWWING